ncbi:MAG TPA: hypothetical protein VIK81_02085 [Patescibacteria group bacterium]
MDEPNLESKETDSFFEKLITALEKHQQAAVRSFKKNHKKTVKWLNSRGGDVGKLGGKVAGQISKGVVTTAVVAATGLPLTAISTPNAFPAPIIEVTQATDKVKDLVETGNLISGLRQSQDRQTEDALANNLSKLTGIKLAAKIDNKGLTRVLGRIGAEQHLYRYPGETINDHLPNTFERANYGPEGIAPHQGAWGYFANNKSNLTPDLVEKEKYYLAVQTFVIPEWNSNWSELKDWFKYRKMLVYNPKNGKNVVAVVADAGPATWTGKHFGGSPEVMEELKLTTGNKSGEVVILLIDDPQDQVPLGPLEKNIGVAFMTKSK